MVTLIMKLTRISRKGLYLILLPGATLLFSSALAAKQVYVSPSGDDGNLGLTIDAPLKTITAALIIARAGDEIQLLPGTYMGKTIMRDIHGEPEEPIILISQSPDSSEFAIIDGGSAPGNDLANRGFELYDCSWITFKNLKFRNCWTDVVVLFNSCYISFAGCDFSGGRRAIYPQGSGCHHFLVERCHWQQHPGVWTSFDWEQMHHGSMAYYNGALLHPAGTDGAYVMRGNVIENVFNAFRTKAGAYNQDGNGELYDNLIMNVADNDFEPEGWAWNIHYYHNRLHNIHKMYSIDDVKGGPVYIYGNVITESKDDNAIDKVSGIFKFKNGPLSLPCYAFNNSYYTEARVMKGDEATNQQMKHFNNAYYFFQGSNRFVINGWHHSYEFDYDCINQSWPPNIVNHGQEQHGLANTDARFVDPENGDFRLQFDSPCFDAGRVMVFPEFNWTQSYQGSAPDIGAFEGEHLIEGPAFRYREPPGGDNFQEKPRIVRHHIHENQITLYFSAELLPNSVDKNAVHVFAGQQEVAVIDVSFPEDNWQVLITTERALLPQDVAIYFAILPLGTNGETATHWASTIRIADKSLITAVRRQKAACLGFDAKELSLSIFPNPFNGQAIATVEVNDGQNFTSGTNSPSLEIFDVTGRKLASLWPQISEGGYVYQLSSQELASGIYFAVWRVHHYRATAKFSVLK